MDDKRNANEILENLQQFVKYNDPDFTEDDITRMMGELEYLLYDIAEDEGNNK